MTEPAAPPSDLNPHEQLHGYFIEDLEVGMSAIYSRTITETDIVLYAGISGDNNPVHLNQEFAEQTQFGGRIAHGMLTASFISTVVGTKLPGPGAIYMSQNLRFTAPVKAQDTVTARAVVTKVDRDKRRCYLDTRCMVNGRDVLVGDALLMVASREQSTR